MFNEIRKEGTALFPFEFTVLVENFKNANNLGIIEFFFFDLMAEY